MTETLPCPDCGAPLSSADLYCWLCRFQPKERRKPAALQAPNKAPKSHPLASAPPSAKPIEDELFTTRSVLFPALFLILLGAMSQGLGCITIMTAICAPAILTLAFADIVRNRWRPAERADSEPKPWHRELLETFLKAVAILVLVWVAICVALFTTCVFALIGQK